MENKNTCESMSQCTTIKIYKKRIKPFSRRTRIDFYKRIPTPPLAFENTRHFLEWRNPSSKQVGTRVDSRLRKNESKRRRCFQVARFLNSFRNRNSSESKCYSKWGERMNVKGRSLTFILSPQRINFLTILFIVELNLQIQIHFNRSFKCVQKILKHEVVSENCVCFTQFIIKKITRFLYFLRDRYPLSFPDKMCHS